MTMKVVLLTIPLGQATLPHTPVQVWERGLNLQSIGLSPLNREVDCYQAEIILRIYWHTLGHTILQNL